MKSKIEKIILDNQWFVKEDKLLLAVSGGVDSMVLMYILADLGYDVTVAHCNFGLRGSESDSDEAFVRQHAASLSLPYVSERFDTEGYAATAKKSHQEAARYLRYAWFEKLRQESAFRWILTAHHANDSVETAVFNFIRGTGLRGLTGIKSVQGAVVRPLLGVTKHELLHYAATHHVPYREDSSNATDKYSRNYIRHRVIDDFKKVNAHFEHTARENIARFQEAQNVVDFFMQQLRRDYCRQEGAVWHVNVADLGAYLGDLGLLKTVLFDILHPFGFTKSNVEQAFDAAKGGLKSGATFRTEGYVLLVERQSLVVTPRQEETENADVSADILPETRDLDLPNARFSFEILENAPETLENDPNVALLDLALLSFPLTIRRWRVGDRFRPLGMAGKAQLLSDFFRARKLANHEKAHTYVVETAKNEICWVVGMRLDERFKLSPKTHNVFKIVLKS